MGSEAGTMFCEYVIPSPYTPDQFRSPIYTPDTFNHDDRFGTSIEKFTY
jgi:hypothetical protein